MLKITEKILAEFKKFQDTETTKLKAMGDDCFDGTFEVVASTQSMDRQGEIVLQSGLDITNYMLNPTVLAFHDYSSLPIGVATEVIKEADKTIIKGKFLSADINPLAQTIRKMYDAGALKTVSIGFIAKEWNGNVCTVSELLELSFVPVPANQDALAIGKKFNLEEKELAMITKGQEFARTMEVEIMEKKVTNSDLKAHMREVMDCMGANHKEMCDKHDELMKKLDEFLNSTKSFAAELVDLKQQSVIGSGDLEAKKLEELSIAGARIASEMRALIKGGKK